MRTAREAQDIVRNFEAVRRNGLEIKAKELLDFLDKEIGLAAAAGKTSIEFRWDAWGSGPPIKVTQEQALGGFGLALATDDVEGKDLRLTEVGEYVGRALTNADTGYRASITTCRLSISWEEDDEER